MLIIESDSLFKRRVFRKPVKTDNVIPITASILWGYKMSVFKSFIRRAHIVYSHKFLEDGSQSHHQDWNRPWVSSASNP